jgi:protoheme IX farnesyltransferase
VTTRRFYKLSLAATIATLVQIGSGGLVRATGSGEGCPDWPKCFGRWVPPLQSHSLIEYSHRLIASIAIMLVLATAVVAVARFRREPRLLWPSVAAAVTIIGLAGIGAAVVKTGLNEALVSVHIAIAMALVGAVVYTTVNAACIDRFERGKVKGPVNPRTARLTVAALIATFAVIILGADVRGSGAALAFKDWPLMDGRLIPDLGGLATRHFLHRVAVLLDGILIAALIVNARKAKPRDAAVAIFSTFAGALFAGQALVGAAQLWTNLASVPVALHVWMSSLVWASLAASFTVTRRLAACAVPELPGRARRPEPMPVSGAQVIAPEEAMALRTVPLRAKLRAYYQLTKPRIIMLLLVTTVPTMILAHRGFPSLWLVLATLAGGALAAGSANAINCYVDRDIDAVMARTRNRPLPLHAVEPEDAMWFGIALGAVSFALLATTVNVLAALLAVAAILFYVFVYTLMLKRSTPQNIVIGGAAGAMPVLVGWAAVTGRLAAAPVMLFFVIYYWTPPHFWALAMRYERDYEAAKVPMLPVIASVRDTTRQIVLYSVLLFAVTLLFASVAHMGAIYVVSAIALGAYFVVEAVRLWRDPSNAAAMRLFKYSITYLTLLFAAVAVDALIRIPAVR